MSDAGAELSHKVGPAPLGVWLAAIAGGVAWGLYRRHKAASVAVAADPGVADSTATDPTAGNLSGPLGDTDTGSGVSAPGTNDEWRALAERRLVATGYSPVAVDAALAHYLAGDQLTAVEGAIVAAAIVVAGPTPSAPPPPSVTGPPSSPPPAPTPHPWRGRPIEYPGPTGVRHNPLPPRPAGVPTPRHNVLAFTPQPVVVGPTPFPPS